MIRLFFIVGFMCFYQSLVAQTIDKQVLYSFVQLQNGSYQEALQALEELNRKEPNPDFYFAQIEAAFHLQRYGEAIELCNKLEKLKPNSTLAFQTKIYLAIDDYKSAQNSLLQNLKTLNKLPLFDLLNNKDYEKLVHTPFLDSVLKSDLYSAADKQIYRVQQLYQQQNYTEALFLVQEIISREENFHKAYFLHSKISNALGDSRKALHMINKALEITRVPVEYYDQKAKLLIEKNNYAEALNIVKKIIRKNPYHFPNYFLAAKLSYHLDYDDKATDLVNELLAVDPDNPEVLILKARILYKDNRYLKALQTVNESFDIKKTKEQYELRGDIYSATGTWEYAVSDFSMYLDIEPFNGYIYAKKGYARFKNSDKKGACYDWEKGKRYGSIDAVRYWDKYCR